MNGYPSSSKRRYLAVWFPWLPSDRLERERRRRITAAPPEQDNPPSPPLVLVEKVKGALRLAAVAPEAAQRGLVCGMTLADARARTPALRTMKHRPERDEALLVDILEDFGRFTPMLAPDPPHGLMLDVTGCAHLFGGEPEMMCAVQTRAGRAGLKIRCALAGTPQAARALARFGPGGVFDEPRPALRRLPVAALELAQKDEQALRRAGLKRLGDLDDRPRAPLAARFGADFPSRLARLLGDEDIRIRPHRPPPPVVVDRVFFEPISAPEDIERVLSDLLTAAADQLDQAGQGGRAFQACFYRLDGATRRITVRTGRPTRDASAILRLFRERLAMLDTPLDAGFGFDQMRMSVPVVERLASIQKGLAGEQPGDEELDKLIDRLTARLGPEAVLRLHPLGSHLPERAARTAPASACGVDHMDWPDLSPENPPLRPLYLFSPPQPVETLAEIPDGSPMRFRWRRVLHETVLVEGPERIAGEWWRAPDQKTRDYYRVEDRQGRRFWLFRQGLYGEDDEPRWFIHGLFA